MTPEELITQLEDSAGVVAGKLKAAQRRAAERTAVDVERYVVTHGGRGAVRVSESETGSVLDIVGLPNNAKVKMLKMAERYLREELEGIDVGS